MSWKEIIKINKRATKRMSEKAKQLVDRIITTTPKPITTILDDMYNELENSHYETTTTRRIPTRGELKNYLNNNYSKILLSDITKKPTNKGRPHYYKEE